MFGLDARIALAIFGGLTIITGAALFAAIRQTAATSLLVELEDLNKAVTQYLLDTGTNYGLGIQDLLVNPSVAGWNGPYLKVETASVSSYRNQRGFAIRTLAYSADPWSATLTDAATACAAVDETCHYYAVVGLSALGGGLVPIELHEKLDEMVDGSDGYETGNYRMREQAGPRYVGYFKGPQRLR